MNAIVERDVGRVEIQYVRAKRDKVIRLAEAREVARILTVFQAARQAMEFDHREHKLIRQIEEL